MFKMKAILAGIGMSAIALAGIACATSEATVKTDAASNTNTTAAAPSSIGAPVPGTTSVNQNQVSSSNQTGIWVTGEGTIKMTPDLALINVGVEAMGLTVTEAREKAATAMTNIINALKANGIAERDIQTQYFNIYPRYEYPIVIENGYQYNKQTLVGYTVNNSALIKVRNVNNAGTIIDEVSKAGGDVTRINGINFTVDDTKPFVKQLREQAVKVAMAKAEHFATLTGVGVGDLIFIAETGGGSPVMQDTYYKAAMESGASTPINVGQLEIRMTVQAAFSIE
ncbi:MAG: DUF541 domain-containing protein [SAR202 cluster bacterium]|nr:DUF541 domain-containing protein [SAR202 cluster bacterium]